MIHRLVAEREITKHAPIFFGTLEIEIPAFLLACVPAPPNNELQ
jgi:hypothetical protein